MFKKPALLSNLLQSGKKPAELLWDNKRIIIINFIILVSTPVFILFTYLNFQHDLIIFAYMNLVNIALLLSTFFYFRFNRNIGHASNVILLVLFLTHITTMFQGGIANTGFFWFFFFPLFAIMLKGHKVGIYWIIALLSSILGMYVYQENYSLELPYEPILLIVLVISLGIESVVALFVESVRVKYDNELQTFNADLAAKVALEVAKNTKKDQQLRQQSKMAAMGEMTNYIAHQWKQPLSAISAIIQSLSVQEELGTLKHETLIDDFEKVNKQVSHMTQTMVDFNNFTKPDQPKENFNVSTVIQEAINIISPLLSSKKIIIGTELSNTEVTVFGQRNFLVHILLNLINNAKDALIAQKIKEPKIVISLDEEGTQIKVSDNGNGVDPSIASSIFEAYFSTKGEESGGVGLHMCKRIIEDSFDGSLELQNTKKGAHFVIHFRTPSSEQ
ncbi:sensor histidine kinase [Campylobacterota bacterium]